MYYAYTKYTPALLGLKEQKRGNGNYPLLTTVETRSLKMGSQWLFVSETGRWCVLEENEYRLFKVLENSKNIDCQTPPPELSAPQWFDFLDHLTMCGLIQPRQSNQDLVLPIKTFPNKFSLTLILSETCNLACKYCYLTMEPKREAGRLDFKTAQNAILASFEQCSEEILIDYGEIAVDYDAFQQLIRFTSSISKLYPSKKTHLAIQTNGTTLKSSVLDFLEAYNVIVGVSLDGPQAVNDAVRLSPHGIGSHSRAEAGLKEIIRRGIPHIVLCTVSRANVHKAAEIVDYFLELGVSHFSFKPVIQRGSAQEAWQSLGISNQEFCVFLDNVVEHAIETRNLQGLDDRLQKFAFRLLQDSRGWTDGCPTADCGCGTQMVVLNPHGQFYPCPRFTSISENRFSLGTQLSRAVTISQRILETSGEGVCPLECHSCVWKPFCRAGCGLSRRDNLLDPACDIYRSTYSLLIRKIFPNLHLFDRDSREKFGNIQIIDWRVKT